MSHEYNGLFDIFVDIKVILISIDVFLEVGSFAYKSFHVW